MNSYIVDFVFTAWGLLSYITSLSNEFAFSRVLFHEPLYPKFGQIVSPRANWLLLLGLQNLIYQGTPLAFEKLPISILIPID